MKYKVKKVSFNRFSRSFREETIDLYETEKEANEAVDILNKVFNPDNITEGFIVVTE